MKTGAEAFNLRDFFGYFYEDRRHASAVGSRLAAETIFETLRGALEQ